jgi:benzoyl-CoA reductase/2-hydroxyglutaryl-CoA dehydratase subunit BcrC/BadD/HgdB
VSAREQRGDEIVDDFVLAHDASSDLLDERRSRARELVEELDVPGIVDWLLSCCHSLRSRL